MELTGYLLSLSAMAILTALYAWLCIRFPPALIFSVVAYSMITKIASLIYIEYVPTLLIQVRLYSDNIGASFRHIAYSFVIFLTALLVMKYLFEKIRKEFEFKTNLFGKKVVDKELSLSILLSYVFLIAQLLNAFMSPPYAFPGSTITRHQFWANIYSPLLEDLFGVLVIFVPAICGAAMAYAKVTGARHFQSASLGLLFLYLLYFLVTGARFNASLIALMFWLAPYWLILWHFRFPLNVRRMVLFVALALVAFLFVGFLEIADRGISRMTGSTWQGFLYRIFAMQGDIYFAADLMVQEGRRAPLALLTEGMERTRLEYMPTRMAQAYAEKGVNLAGSLPANSIFVFGFWIGILPMIVYGILLGAFSALHAYFILTGRFILLFLSAYLCMWTYTGYTQGSFSPFFDFKFAIFCLLVLVYLMSPMGTQKKTRPMKYKYR